MKRSAPLKRSPLSRRSRLRPRSAKRRREQHGRDAGVAVARERSHGRCEIQSPVCTGWGEHGHERRKSSSGGSRTNPRNVLWSCDPCNGFVEDFPAIARTMKATNGQSVVVREGDAEWHQLGRKAAA